MEGVLKPEENEKLEKSSERLVLKEGQGVEERVFPGLNLPLSTQTIHHLKKQLG